MKLFIKLIFFFSFLIREIQLILAHCRETMKEVHEIKRKPNAFELNGCFNAEHQYVQLVSYQTVNFSSFLLSFSPRLFWFLSTLFPRHFLLKFLFEVFKKPVQCSERSRVLPWSADRGIFVRSIPCSLDWKWNEIETASISLLEEIGANCFSC